MRVTTINRRERQVRREYRRAKERDRVARIERRIATGMLLDAEWDEHMRMFVQRTVAGGYPVVCYYNEEGEVVPPSRIPNRLLERWHGYRR